MRPIGRHNYIQHNRLIYDTQHNSIDSIECRYADCRIIRTGLEVIMLSVVMLSLVYENIINKSVSRCSLFCENRSKLGYFNYANYSFLFFKTQWLKTIFDVM